MLKIVVDLPNIFANRVYILLWNVWSHCHWVKSVFLESELLLCSLTVFISADWRDNQNNNSVISCLCQSVLREGKWTWPVQMASGVEWGRWGSIWSWWSRIEFKIIRKSPGGCRYEVLWWHLEPRGWRPSWGMWVYPKDSAFEEGEWQMECMGEKSSSDSCREDEVRCVWKEGEDEGVLCVCLGVLEGNI